MKDEKQELAAQTEEKDLTLEEAFNELDTLVGKMQSDELSLEESFALYKKGVALTELCSGKIDKVECEIKKLK